MTPSAKPARPFALRTLAALQAAVTLPVLAGGGLLTWRLAGPPGLGAAAEACGINVAVFVLSAAAVYRVHARKGPGAAGKAFMALGIGRMALTFALALLVLRVAHPAPTVFGAWLAGLYLVLLMEETWWASGGLRPRALAPPGRRQ